MKPLLEGKGISVQAQNSHSVQTIHQRGEQTINRDAKTTAKKYGSAVHRQFLQTGWTLMPFYVTPHPSYSKFLAWYLYMNACNKLVFEYLTIAL